MQKWRRLRRMMLGSSGYDMASISSKISSREICTDPNCNPDSTTYAIDRIHKVRVPDKNSSDAPISFVYVTGPESFRSEKPSSPPGKNKHHRF